MDKPVVFKDALGLPESLDLITTNDQRMYQYQVRQSTNFLGWTIPLEFYAVQYLPIGSNAWKVHLTMKGRVTDIHAGTKPRVPDEVLQRRRPGRNTTTLAVANADPLRYGKAGEA